MDSEIEVEDISEHAFPDPISDASVASNCFFFHFPVIVILDYGALFYKTLFACALVAVYLVLSHFGGAFAAWLSKRTTHSKPILSTYI